MGGSKEPLCLCSYLTDFLALGKINYFFDIIDFINYD